MYVLNERSRRDTLRQMETPSSVIVVGAGLAGLSAALAVHRAGHAVTVLEAGDGVGGRVRSDVVDGFVIDRGFQVLQTAYPEVRAQLDLEALDVHAFSPGAMVWRDGRGHVVGDPLRDPRSLLGTVRAPVGSIADKLRILALRRDVLRTHPADLLRRPETTTRERLQRAGFSDDIVDRFFRPLFAGIQLDPDLETSSRMFDVIFRSLATGDSVLPANGIGVIPAQLASSLPEGTIHLGVVVDGVEAGGVRVADGDRMSADAVIVATDGPSAARLLGLPDPGSRSVASVHFATSGPPFDGRFIALDGDGGGPAANVAVLSAVAPSYAPVGQALVVAACPAAPAGTDLVADVRRQLTTWFGPMVAEWDVIAIHQIDHGQPDQRPPFDPKRRVRLSPALYVCGDHRDTGSVQGAMFSGRRTGETVIADLVGR